MIPLLENKALRAVTGDTIRPGGFELTDRAVAFCALPERSRVLDIGCGTGATVTRLRQRHRLAAFGLDPSAGFLREGRHRDPGIPLIRSGALPLPICREKLAGVFCECVLSLISDAASVLHEFHRTLLPSGFLILTDLYLRCPAPPPTRYQWPVRSCLAGAMTQPELESRVENSGFRILLWEDHSALLRELTARLILAGEPLQSLWGGTCTRQMGVPSAARRAMPGYGLLIAEKRDEICRTNPE